MQLAVRCPLLTAYVVILVEIHLFQEPLNRLLIPGVLLRRQSGICCIAEFVVHFLHIVHRPSSIFRVPLPEKV
jgi:hypothetical protein